MEIANAYYGRGKEIEKMILKAERRGVVDKGDSYYKFRTGELRAFNEVAKASQELGLRRHVAARDEIDPF